MIYPKVSRVLLTTCLLGIIATTLSACGIKGNLTPPSQIKKEERSEATRRQGRDTEKPL